MSQTEKGGPNLLLYIPSFEGGISVWGNYEVPAKDTI